VRKRCPQFRQATRKPGNGRQSLAEPVGVLQSFDLARGSHPKLLCGVPRITQQNVRRFGLKSLRDILDNPYAWESAFGKIASLDRIALRVLRAGLILVLAWMGGLRFANYEAENIVPLIANSPLTGEFYTYTAPEYQQYMNKEGELVRAHREWHASNGTYAVSHTLGIVTLLIALLLALHGPFPQAATFGSALLVGLCCVTLSFLVTTPEAWVPAAGDSAHGFPYLSCVGRLLVKDSIMCGAALVTMADSAKAYLRRRNAPNPLNI
jgi:reactive chlorine resistance protein C